MKKVKDYSENNYFSNIPLFKVEQNDFALKGVNDFLNAIEKEKDNISLSHYFSDLIKNVNDYVKNEKTHVNKFLLLINGHLTSKNKIGFSFILFAEDEENETKIQMTKLNGTSRYYSAEIEKDEKVFNINLINVKYTGKTEKDINDIEFLKTNGVEIINCIIQYLQDCLDIGEIMAYIDQQDLDDYDEDEEEFYDEENI